MGVNMELLAFIHPEAGCQIVKGTREHGEKVSDACVRELHEEAGLSGHPTQYLGTMFHSTDHQYWHFYRMSLQTQVPDRFTHYTADDGGHIFTFYWHRLSEPLSDHWHPRYTEPMEFLRSTLLHDVGLGGQDSTDTER